MMTDTEIGNMMRLLNRIATALERLVELAEAEGRKGPAERPTEMKP